MADTEKVPAAVPLIVDLDGTLIRTDMMWESLARLLKRNPFAIFAILFWWTRGRAWLKHRLALKVHIAPAPLPYNEKFLDWLREEKKSGRKLVLATASDIKMARPIADYVGIFDEVMASNGRTNLRSENKRRALEEKYGERGFDYAGNSTADFAVWRGARQAIVVNASRRVLREAANCTQLGPTFCDHYSSIAILKSVFLELFWRSGYAVGIFAGLLLASAFPGLNLAGFAWVAPAVMLAAAHGRTGADAFRVGYVAGLTFWLATLYWLLLIPVTGFPIVGWFALSAYVALFFGLWTWLLAGKVGEGNWSQRFYWTLIGAAVWVALEFLRSNFLGGFPWTLIGVSQFKLVPLIQIASVTGVYGVSFLVVWFSLALYSGARMIYLNPTKRYIWQGEIVLPMVAVVVLFGLGMARVSRETPAPESLHVTIVQPSIPQSLIWSPGTDARRFQDLLALSQRALTNQTDLLLWPESAVPDLDEPTYEAINQFARSNHLWIILNGDDVEVKPDATNYYNSAFLVGPDGDWRQVYHKQRLVIFGEYVPLTRWLPFLKLLTPIVGGWTPGDRAVQFVIRPPRFANADNVISINGPPAALARQVVKVSPLICFEDVFPDLARAATDGDTDFLVNLTNDGWFGNGAEQWQQAAAAVFRAVENNVPLVRCANNGVSCLIDSKGRIVQVLLDKQGDVHGVGALTVDVPLPDEHPAPTYYHRHGDWLAWSCSILTLLAFARHVLGRRHASAHDRSP